ncbi:hypothetical protein V5P93_006481 [Actinokineospora auranticolor]|uniref:Uncharacterized protein n=1 Tax=Actinokineospora auranticolor TaxID=155976 RepID=A0A2S6GXI5_9PSEU|nr:hypothetical protein [Actinokineospora auranticolor]PPK69880.1 hypothetical protein CLV40_103490 [Actinokineospora auranticolor]
MTKDEFERFLRETLAHQADLAPRPDRVLAGFACRRARPVQRWLPLVAAVAAVVVLALLVTAPTWTGSQPVPPAHQAPASTEVGWADPQWLPEGMAEVDRSQRVDRAVVTRVWRRGPDSPTAPRISLVISREGAPNVLPERHRTVQSTLVDGVFVEHITGEDTPVEAIRWHGSGQPVYHLLGVGLDKPLATLLKVYRGLRYGPQPELSAASPIGTLPDEYVLETRGVRGSVPDAVEPYVVARLFGSDALEVERRRSPAFTDGVELGLSGRYRAHTAGEHTVEEVSLPVPVGYVYVRYETDLGPLGQERLFQVAMCAEIRGREPRPWIGN